MNKAKRKQRNYQNRLRLARRKVRLIFHDLDDFEKFIRSMTNWQNSQWLRHGADRKLAEMYSNLKRENRVLQEIPI